MVTITIDDVPIAVEKDEPIAAVFLRLPPFTTRTTPVTGAPRAPFCMMGVCFDCLAEVDGITSTRSCMVRAAEGMRIYRQAGRPNPLRELACD